MTQDRDPNAVYCKDLVRECDLDRYLSTLLADKEKHRALFAIYAFDAEVSGIAAKVTEPGIGEIRLQWWRDELDTVYGGDCDDHPIASELQKIVRKHDLPKHLFAKLIDAHQFDIYREPMVTLDGLMAYQLATAAAITDLVARVLIGHDALEVQALTDKAGIARGLGKMIQSLPQQVALKQCFLPADLLNERDASFREVLSGQSSIGIKLVVTQLCHLTTENLSQIRFEQGTIKKNLLPAYFPASIAGQVANQTTRSSANPLRDPAVISQLKMQWFLFKKSFFEQV